MHMALRTLRPHRGRGPPLRPDSPVLADLDKERVIDAEPSAYIVAGATPEKAASK